MYVIYTSGSTGQPKGVMIQHDGFLNMIQTQIDVFGVLPHDRVLQFASPGFDASLSEIFMALLCGAAVVMIPDAVIRDPYTFLRFMTDYRVTVATLPPAYLHVLPRVDMAPLRVLITAGEAAIAEDLIFHSRSRTVFNAYGPTEASVCAAIYRLDSNALVAATRASAKTEAGDIPIGQPLPGAPVYLLAKGYSGALVSAMGPEDKPAIPIGVSGEICIAGVGLARGYMNRPDLTAEKFISHPYLHSQRLYRSGDMGKWRADGQLVFLGRIDDQIKVRGFRIEPNEIASALRSHPQVKDSAVIKWSPDGKTDELLAFVQFVMDTGRLLQTAGADPNACPSLQNYLAERLPRYCLPDRIIPVDMLQLTPSGKIDRQALLAVAAKSESREQRQVAAPSNDLEKILLEAFSSVLGKKELNKEADFFDWGGNSLKAIRLSTLLCEQLKQEIPVRMIFLHPTVAQLAAMLHNEEQGTVKNNQTVAPCQETHGPPPYGPEADSQLLDASFTPPPWPQSWPDSRAIFLTGASGFLGAFLLAELLEQTHATLHCLVRCNRPEDGMARLISKLKTVDLWHPEYERRIAPIPGDLAKPLFGLDPRAFSELGQCLDMIYHNGALVDFLQPYQRLRAENVLGTQTILNLATIGPAKRLHFVSTLSVFPKQGQGLSNEGRDKGEGRVSGEKSFATNNTVSDAWIDEQDPPAHWTGLETGYDQSKWAAEKLVLAARDKGLAVTIFRPGRITGHSQSGLSDPQSLFVRSLRGYIELNMVSDRYADEDMTPVDFAAKALVMLSLKPDAIGKIFHLINPQPMPAPLILSCLQQAGYKLDIVPDSQWRERMVAKLEMQPHNPLFPFLPLIKELPASLSVQRFGCSNTLKYLAGTGVICPPADAALFQTYLKYITG
jgi:thioester reductase-like protein/amino acid adenylation domain-containing protein